MEWPCVASMTKYGTEWRVMVQNDQLHCSIMIFSDWRYFTCSFHYPLSSAKNDSFLDRSFLNRLKSSLGITGDISDTELGQLCMRNQEEAVDYIDRAQIVYSNIIEAEKSLRGLLTNADIARINERFLRSFYSGLSSDLRTLEQENETIFHPPKYMRWLKARIKNSRWHIERSEYTSSHRFPLLRAILISPEIF